MTKFHSCNWRTTLPLTRRSLRTRVSTHVYVKILNVCVRMRLVVVAVVVVLGGGGSRPALLPAIHTDLINYTINQKLRGLLKTTVNYILLYFRGLHTDECGSS